MSLQLQATYLIPEATVYVARAAFPHGNVYMQMYDALGPIYTDQQFTSLFPSRGQPAESPARLALVLVMQFAENLTDRQAADAVRGRIDWKYALGLELTDPGFDFSVLSEFRTRLIKGQAEHSLLDTLLARFSDLGLLKSRTRQRTDSTHILAAIRSLNRLERVGRTLQHALNALAQSAPEWLRAHIPADWFDRYRHLIDEYRLPKSDTARHELAVRIGRDGVHVLACLDRDAPAAVQHLPAIGILRQVWAQAYSMVGEHVRWHTTDDLPPAATCSISPHDVDARWSTKRSVTWVGYKVHLTETCDSDVPNLITHVATTPATADASTALPLMQRELAAADRLPHAHFVDTGYTSGGMLVHSQAQYGISLVGPVPPDTSWQAQTEDGYDISRFTVDWQAQQVTCPEGKRSKHWNAGKGARGKPAIQVQFHDAECRACPARACCTRNKAGARELTLRPQAEQEALQAARQRQATDAFKQQYAVRAGVEGTISQAVVARDMRRSRYVGHARTHLQHVLTASAINFTRVAAWWQGIPRAKTRRSPFAALAPT